MKKSLTAFLKTLGAILRIAIYTFSIAFMCAALWLVDAFQKPPKLASRSPANPVWRAAVVFTGFRNPTYDLRAYHDRFFLMRSPVEVGTLGDMGDWGFEPASVFWSNDGTLVLAKIRFRDGSVAYQCGRRRRRRSGLREAATGTFAASSSGALYSFAFCPFHRQKLANSSLQL